MDMTDKLLIISIVALILTVIMVGYLNNNIGFTSEMIYSLNKCIWVNHDVDYCNKAVFG